jgi:hypothetical protein
MIIGSHVLLYSKNADADRAFLRDVLEFSSVDAGHGWLIFKLPPAEIALHPAEDKSDAHKMLQAGFYLMCDDLQATIKSLEAKKVKCTAITKERWGILTTIQLPSGGELGLYQPLHPIALNLS